MLAFIIRALGGLCHQLPAHSLSPYGQALPLCARCTGMHVAGASALLYLALARRKSQRCGLPDGPAALMLLAFMVLWALDGSNSLLHLLSGWAIYQPSNALRLFTGAGMGLTLGLSLYPTLRLVLKPIDTTCTQPVASRLVSLVGPCLAAAGGLLVIVLLPWVGVRDVLLFTAALTLLAAANGLLVTIALERWVSLRARWFWPLGVGVALAQMSVLAWLRSMMGA